MAVGITAAAIPASASTAAVVPGYDYAAASPFIDYTKTTATAPYKYGASFQTPADKLQTMNLMLSANGMELYVEPVSGEVAYRNTKTGQILFSNPFNVAQITATEEVKNKLLSQIFIKYAENGVEKDLYSFQEAALRGQITVKETKSGVRVEYVIGREENRKLVPKHIEKSRFENEILAKMVNDTVAYQRVNAWYTPQFPDEAAKESERKLRDMNAAYPITKEGMSIYVFDDGANDRELDFIESYIKRYCTDYDYDDLEYDHELTKYEGSDKAPVLFRLSLEYSLDELGNLDVRLPANGIRFDESAYQLISISVLPWFGAGCSTYEGYTMFPDGSGALVRFEDAGDEPIILTNKIYGQDYAYQKIEGENKEVMRLPVYGIYESNEPAEKAADGETGADDSNHTISADAGTEDATATKLPVYEGHKEVSFVAIIEEGESLASITTEHGAGQYPYITVYSSFCPRSSDSYNLAETYSNAGSDAVYSMVSDRKYSGSYRIKYIMQTGSNETHKHGDNHYEAGYVGMAKAYREYLINKGILTEKKDSKGDIPLYVESFGSINTIEKILSMPVEVLKPLTTFDDLEKMYEELSKEGIKNVNYKLTGFANGGLNSTSAYHVDFDKAVGGNKGFTEFVNGYAKKNNIGVYPDFDFANVGQFEAFDGVNNKDHMIKTLDGRYTTKRYYDSTLQSFERGHSLAVSPSVYNYFFENFNKEYSKLNPSGVSVATLGTDLNSDFDKKNPFNREDSKAFTAELLGNLNTAYNSVMIDGGNAYTLAYADHILNVPLDSSRFSRADEAIPFMGMVLHGCVDFAGSPINMAGDTMYELLKAIENGSSLYFTLSMQNTELLKEDEMYNKYYSVKFDIWFKDVTDNDKKVAAEDAQEDNALDTVVELYKTLNNELKSLQNQQIIGHEFITGDILDDDGETVRSKAVVTEDKDDEEEDDFDPYLSNEGRIVKVTYENGTVFILNYNNYGVQVSVNDTLYNVDPINYIVIK